MIYEFEIVMNDVDPQVSRTIQIPAHATFADLHKTIQIAFDWHDYHMHDFWMLQSHGIENEDIEIAPILEEEKMLPSMRELVDERQALLSEWVTVRDDQMIYTYDYGDNWEHDVKLVKVVEAESVPYPRCMAANHLAPPEDSRFELLNGEIDLSLEEVEPLVKGINDLFLEESFSFTNKEIQKNYWPQALRTAKKFQKLKPWTVMEDDTFTFAIIDLRKERYYFCSVMGGEGELFGLAVYEGIDGYSALLGATTDEMNDFTIFQRTRGMTVTFEDRTDLLPQEYKLIKTYDIPFRGKKSWPSFMSYQPGHGIWELNQDEVQIITLALEQAMGVFEIVQSGTHIPDFFVDKEVLVREIAKDGTVDSVIYDTDSFLFYGHDFSLTLSELELKRLEKLKRKANETLEFSLTYVNLPLQLVEWERPVYPLVAFGILHSDGSIFHHDMLEGTLTAEKVQQQFVRILTTLGYIPSTILVDDQTYLYLIPVLEKLRLHLRKIEVISLLALPILEEVFEGMGELLEKLEDHDDWLF